MPSVIIDAERCKGCGLCAEVCPQKLIVISKTFNAGGYHPAVVADESACAGCAFCAMMCPDIAIRIEK